MSADRVWQYTLTTGLIWFIPLALVIPHDWLLGLWLTTVAFLGLMYFWQRRIYAYPSSNVVYALWLCSWLIFVVRVLGRVW